MSLAYYYSLLAKKQSDLQRLVLCKSKLAGKQSEFAENQQYMIKPSLTPTTWHGNWATSFDDVRRNGILESYNEIQTSQFNNTFAVIARKMEEIIQEIERIRQIIAQLLADKD